MILRHYFWFFFATVLFIGLANASAISSGLSKQHWKIEKVYCPVGCAPGIKSFLESQVGAAVEFSSSQFSAPFIDHCDGEIRVLFSQATAQEVVAEINKGLAPNRQMTVESLQVGTGPVTSAIVYCKNGELDLPIARIPIVESARILVLFEEQSIVELR